MKPKPWTALVGLKGRTPQRRAHVGPVRRRSSRGRAGARKASHLREPGPVLRPHLPAAAAPRAGQGRGASPLRQDRPSDPAAGAHLRRRQDAHADHAVPPLPRPGDVAGLAYGDGVPRARGREPAAGVRRDAVLRQDRRREGHRGRARTERRAAHPQASVERAGLSAGGRRRTARHPRGRQGRRTRNAAGRAAPRQVAGGSRPRRPGHDDVLAVPVFPPDVVLEAVREAVGAGALWLVNGPSS